MEKQIKSKKMLERRKAVIYARYSSDNQREESIEGQIRECKEYAEHNNILVIDTYIDRALTATSDKRPEFQRMISDSAKQVFDIVLVWKLDRFSRDRYDSAHYKHILKKHYVKVVSAKETIAEGSAGILLESMLEGYAEYYSAELSEKVRRGLKENALKKRANGGNCTFGYYVDSDRHYQVDESSSLIVKEMFEKYASGMKVTEISRMLVSRGINAVGSDEFSIRAVQRILANRKYIGEYRFGDTILPDSMPAIVSKELFDKVQLMLVKNKRQPFRHTIEEDYLLTTKLYCGVCGAMLNGESGTSKTGAKHQYYKCCNVRRKKCDKKTIKKSVIEDIINKAVIDFLCEKDIIENLINTIYDLQATTSTKIPYLQEQFRDIEKKIANLFKAIEEGICTQSTKMRMFELEETKSKLELSILEEQIKKPLLSKEQIAFAVYKFCKLDLSCREAFEMMIHNFINVIYIYDDRLEIVFNYKENTTIIDLNELKSSYPTTLTPPYDFKSEHFRYIFKTKVFGIIIKRY